MKQKKLKKGQIPKGQGQSMAAQTIDTNHFAASRTAREIANWNPRITSADAALLPELERIRSRNRDLYRNNGIASGAKQTLKDNVVGIGLTLCAKPNYQVLGKDKDWADQWSSQVQPLWREFAESKYCDVAEELTFDQLTSLIYDSKIQNGEACAIPLWLRNRRSRFATCLQVIESDRLCNPNDMPDTDKLRGGVEFSGYGVPVFYNIKRYHPGDHTGTKFLYNDWLRIPARTAFGRRRFIHYYDKERPNQSRGKPLATAVLASFNMAGHYQLTELQAAIVNSKIAAFIESNMSPEEAMGMLGISSEEYIQLRNSWSQSLQSGAIIQVPIGDKVSGFTPSRPATAFAHFMQAIAREIGVGLNLPYELVMKDFSKSNYSSARAALLEAWRYFASERKSLGTGWASEVYTLFLEEVVNRGWIEAPDFYQYKAAYCRAEWIGSGRGWIDPLKEADASGKRMQLNISTLQDECAQQGKDWEEVLEQRAREHKKAKELGIDLMAMPPPDNPAGEELATTSDDEEEEAA